MVALITLSENTSKDITRDSVFLLLGLLGVSNAYDGGALTSAMVWRSVELMEGRYPNSEDLYKYVLVLFPFRLVLVEDIVEVRNTKDSK